MRRPWFAGTRGGTPLRSTNGAGVFLTPYLHESQAAVAIISQMITPAIFILATGNLINVNVSRLGRIVDRTRLLLSQLPDARQNPGDYAKISNTLKTYRRRSAALEYGLTAYYIAVACFVLASLFVALSVLEPHLVALPTILSVIGALFVLLGSGGALCEIRIATGLLRKEIDEEL